MGRVIKEQVDKLDNSEVPSDHEGDRVLPGGSRIQENKSVTGGGETGSTQEESKLRKTVEELRKRLTKEKKDRARLDRRSRDGLRCSRLRWGCSVSWRYPGSRSYSGTKRRSDSRRKSGNRGIILKEIEKMQKKLK